ncbi:MAG: SIS domain-containing protein, partial [Candidatus Omnitrophota bacterium]
MILKRASEVLRIEAKAVEGLVPRLGDGFVRAVRLVAACRGRVVVSGMGKGGLIGQKISATLSSLGTPSLWLHCAEAIHGDLGRLRREDVIIVLSNSGETDEVRRLLPLIKKIGAKIIAITGNVRSTLARYSDFVLDAGVRKEACSLGLAPTSSTTAMLALGDALAVCVVEEKGFRRE